MGHYFSPMVRIQAFTFNPFSENTYVVSDENGECAIIDPGMSDNFEEQQLTEYISGSGLRPVLLLNSHCHIDHILGNEFCGQKYGLPLQMHEADLPTLARGEQSAMLFGVNYSPFTGEKKFIEPGSQIVFGNTTFEVRFVPGHAPGHIAFVNWTEKFVMGGDVLFRGSVGRVDLPGCDPAALVKSIRNELYTLPADFVVYPGHGPETTIGEEMNSNYFVSAHSQKLVS